MRTAGAGLQPRRRIYMTDAEPSQVRSNLGSLIESEVPVELQSISGSRNHDGTGGPCRTSCRTKSNSERPVTRYCDPNGKVGASDRSGTLVSINTVHSDAPAHSGSVNSIGS